MRYEVGEILKVNKEALENTKRCRVNGKTINGKHINFMTIRAGREGIPLKVINTLIGETLVEFEMDGSKKHQWVHNCFLVRENLILDEAEDF